MGDVTISNADPVEVRLPWVGNFYVPCDPIGPSMPCAHPQCVLGEVLIIPQWEAAWPASAQTLTTKENPRQIMFRREAWRDDTGRQWLEWAPYDFRRGVD